MGVADTVKRSAHPTTKGVANVTGGPLAALTQTLASSGQLATGESTESPRSFWMILEVLTLESS